MASSFDVNGPPPPYQAHVDTPRRAVADSFDFTNHTLPEHPTLSEFDIEFGTPSNSFPEPRPDSDLPSRPDLWFWDDTDHNLPAPSDILYNGLFGLYSASAADLPQPETSAASTPSVVNTAVNSIPTATAPVDTVYTSTNLPHPPSSSLSTTPSGSSRQRTAAILKTFEAIIHIRQPVPIATKAGSKRSRRGSVAVTTATKVQIKKYGPIDLRLDATWDAFRADIAEPLSVLIDALDLASMEYKLVKPANSPIVPLRDNHAYTSFIRHVSQKPEVGVYIYMDPPCVHPPTTAPTTSATPAPFPCPSPLSNANDDLSDGEDHPQKKPRFDDSLQPFIDEIDEKYPPGLCSAHPDKQCFYHLRSKLHFELDRPRKLVWGAAIKKGSATINTIPISSTLFRAKFAMKVSSSNSTDTIPSAGPIPAAAYPFTFTFPHPSFPAHPMYPNAMHHAPMWGSGSQPQGSQQPEPLRTDGTVDEFCQMFNLSAEIKAGLDALGFEIGDDLSPLSQEDWKAAGFKPLVWQRVCQSYMQYQHRN
ncbi:hypothetical protein BDN72DRAFT_922060 [Pluteus cervinus]|uniref:Uncharacterized protein n=1 Tax=Pluteus cervinus TaxID=181527 RepID=A0ACD3AHZ8_9AGAR|nr:hypothetical protein BDN72DRAFT_922060 [Pluteus cervinus]